MKPTTFLATCALLGVLTGGLLAWPPGTALDPGLETGPVVSGPVLSYRAGIQRAAPSVVSVYSRSSPSLRQPSAQGSGVIISTDGLVLTNAHLVADAGDIHVVLDPGTLHRATLIGSDPETDLAVLRIAATGLPALPLKGARTLQTGDVVLAIGNPFGVGQTVTLGIVSATRRRVAGASAWQSLVQIDAAINPGNSGGALIDPNGQLVGLTSAVFGRGNRTQAEAQANAQGIGFAIAFDVLAQVVPQIIRDGRVIRGWLGIDVDDLMMYPELMRESTRGAVVIEVQPGSPAESAGLQSFDIVTELDDTPVSHAEQLLFRSAALAPGTRVVVTVLRRGQALRLPLTLGERG